MRVIISFVRVHFDDELQVGNFACLDMVFEGAAAEHLTRLASQRWYRGLLFGVN